VDFHYTYHESLVIPLAHRRHDKSLDVGDQGAILIDVGREMCVDIAEAARAGEVA
jgi:hypothetical protein